MNIRDAKNTSAMADALREAKNPQNQIAHLRGEINNLEYTKGELIGLLLDMVGLMSRVCDALSTELDERSK